MDLFAAMFPEIRGVQDSIQFIQIDRSNLILIDFAELADWIGSLISKTNMIGLDIGFVGKSLLS